MGRIRGDAFEESCHEKIFDDCFRYYVCYIRLPYLFPSFPDVFFSLSTLMMMLLPAGVVFLRVDERMPLGNGTSG